MTVCFGPKTFKVHLLEEELPGIEEAMLTHGGSSLQRSDRRMTAMPSL